MYICEFQEANMNCTVCGKTMDGTARFCSPCASVMYSEQVYAVAPQIVRPRYGRMIAGVCAGIAQRYGFDVTLVRLALVLLTVFTCFSGVLAYIIAWIVIPNGRHALPPEMMTQPAQPVGPTSDQTGATAS
jgi:phage shock protein C